MVDRLSPAQRSQLMSKVRSFDTRPERILRSALHLAGHRFRKHVAQLPGKPDVVFTRARVAVFIDGDFWHGYRFPAWRSTLPEYWQLKIGRNRTRDRLNFSRLRRRGWTVLRLWEHEIYSDLDCCVARVACAIAAAPGLAPCKGKTSPNGRTQADAARSASHTSRLRQRGR
jgi:DNA mismatch endonuclease, patch repair protein